MDSPIIPSEKQRLALQYLYDDKTNFVGYGGAAFGGKSYLLCRWLTNMMLQHPGTAYGLARKTLVNLKKTTLLTLFTVFKECNIKDGRDYIYNGQLNTITFFNESVLFLIGLAYQPSDPLYTELGGYELTSAGVDESVECPIEAINILFTRTGRKKNREYGIKRKILETFNPAKNHVYRRYYKPHKDGTLRPTYKFVTALPTDNPSLETKEYVQGILDNSDQVTIERLIYGNFEYDDDPAKLMDYDSITNLFTNTFITGIGERTFISADIARMGKDLTVIMVWKGWRVVEIQSYKETTVVESIRYILQLANKYNLARSNIVVDEDGVGGGVVDGLHCKGFVNNSKPIEIKGKKENYKNLKSQCYFMLADKVNGNEIFIDTSDATVIQKLTEELEVVKDTGVNSENKKAVISKDKIMTLIGRSPDYSDCLMMRMYLEIYVQDKVLSIEII